VVGEHPPETHSLDNKKGTGKNITEECPTLEARDSWGLLIKKSHRTLIARNKQGGQEGQVDNMKK